MIHKFIDNTIIKVDDIVYITNLEYYYPNFYYKIVLVYGYEIQKVLSTRIEVNEK